VEFRLLDLVPLSPERWRAEVALLFDHGPAPRAAPAPGYERLRAGRYQLVIGARDGALALVRVTPKGGIHLLPA